MYMRIGDAIYLWRNYRGMTQAELARDSKVPRPNLVAIESGEREVSLPTLRLLAHALNITPGDLINGNLPIAVDRNKFSRDILEKIASINYPPFGAILSKITKNRVEAIRGNFRKSLKGRKDSIYNWLLLKAVLGNAIVNNLLSRQEKKNLIWIRNR